MAVVFGAQVGRAVIKREKKPIPINSKILLLHSQLPLLELLMYCVDMGHMSILVRYSQAIQLMLEDVLTNGHFGTS